MPQWAGWALKALSGKFYKSSNAASSTSPTTESFKNNEVSEKTNVVSNNILPSCTISKDNWNLDLLNAKRNTSELFIASSTNADTDELNDWGDLDNDNNFDLSNFTHNKINTRKDSIEDVLLDANEKDGWNNDSDFFDAPESFSMTNITEKTSNVSLEDEFLKVFFKLFF